MADPVKNFAIVTVSTGYDDAAVTIDLTAGHGAKLPTPSVDGEFNLVWWNASTYSNPADDPNVEVVRCTARSTDQLTVTRAQESTSATVKNTAGSTYKMILAMTKKVYDDLYKSGGTDVPVADGGTGASDAATARTNLGLGTAAVEAASAFAPAAGSSSITTVGTISSGNVVGGIANASLAVAKLANGTDGELITWDASGVATVVAAGTSGQVLTSNGAGAAPTFQAAAGGSAPPFVISTCHETAARFTDTVNASATITYGASGVVLTTADTNDSYVKHSLVFHGGSENGLAYGLTMAFSTAFQTSYSLACLALDFACWLGAMTVAAAGITKTERHIGFRVDKTAGVETYYATNADGTTETTTNITASSPSALCLTAVQNGSTNIKFYKHATLMATHTTNIAAANYLTQMNCALDNKNGGDSGDANVSLSSLSFYPA